MLKLDLYNPEIPAGEWVWIRDFKEPLVGRRFKIFFNAGSIVVFRPVRDMFKGLADQIQLPLIAVEFVTTHITRDFRTDTVGGFRKSDVPEGVKFGIDRKMQVAGPDEPGYWICNYSMSGFIMKSAPQECSFSDRFLLGPYHVIDGCGFMEFLERLVPRAKIGLSALLPALPASRDTLLEMSQCRYKHPQKSAQTYVNHLENLYCPDVRWLFEDWFKDGRLWPDTVFHGWTWDALRVCWAMDPFEIFCTWDDLENPETRNKTLEFLGTPPQPPKRLR